MKFAQRISEPTPLVSEECAENQDEKCFLYREPTNWHRGGRIKSLLTDFSRGTYGEETFTGCQTHVFFFDLILLTNKWYYISFYHKHFERQIIIIINLANFRTT